MSDDLRKLEADLLAAGPEAQRQSYKATVVQAHKMRDEWRGIVSGVTGLGGLEPAISYDILPAGLRSVTAEVGFDKRGQGNLGNLAEFGSSTQGPIRPGGERVLKNGAEGLDKFLGGLDPL